MSLKRSTLNRFVSYLSNSPNTNVSRPSAVVFCNALTEWYIEKSGTELEPVYYYQGIPLRSSWNDLHATNAVIKQDADGFRLMKADEWELAARWRSDDTISVFGYEIPCYFTKGDSASGANDDIDDRDETRRVAWYDYSTNTKLEPVKQKDRNSLGFYDMNGNANSWCQDRAGGDLRVTVDGSIGGGERTFASVGARGYNTNYNTYYHTGVRIARSTFMVSEE